MIKIKKYIMNILYKMLVIKKYEKNIKKHLKSVMEILLPYCIEYKMHLAFGMVLKWYRDKTLFHNDIDLVALPGFNTKDFLKVVKNHPLMTLKAISWTGDFISALTIDILGCPVGVSISRTREGNKNEVISLYPKNGTEIKKYKKNEIMILEGYSACSYAYDEFEMGEITEFKGISFIPPKNIEKHLEQAYSTSWITPIESNEKTPFEVGEKQAKLNILLDETKVEIFKRR